MSSRNRSQARLSILLLVCLLSSLPDVLLAGGEPQSLRRAGLSPRIVNGLNTTAYPSVVALVNTADDLLRCSGTFVGCSTVLTAAHCVCYDTGLQCQPGGSALLAPSQIKVFAQHGGFFPVSTITVPSGYVFGTTSDVALLELSQPVDGISPIPINFDQDPADGLQGTIVGFGLSDGNLDDYGLKRAGQVETSSCFVVADASHVCWSFTAPVGAPGSDSNTCSGDSGGPLFLDLGQGPVLAGVTSGGLSQDCQPYDASWDANVYYDRAWLLTHGGVDLDSVTCGSLPQAGSPEAPIYEGEAVVSADDPQATFTFDVPEAALALRVATNGEEGPLFSLTDVDLFLRAGAPATILDFDCTSGNAGVYEMCEIIAPQAGIWYVLVDRRTGQGTIQVTATVFSEDSAIFSDGFESGDVTHWSSSSG